MDETFVQRAIAKHTSPELAAGTGDGRYRGSEDYRER
jgi:hypothetical protein